MLLKTQLYTVLVMVLKLFDLDEYPPVNKGSDAMSGDLSMARDLLELKHLNLTEDLIARRRLLDIRCVQRKFSNRVVAFTQGGFIVQGYLPME